MFQGGDFFSLVLSPPGATIFILILATLINLGSALLTRWLANPKEIARKQSIIKEHQEQKKAIENFKEEDPVRYSKELMRWKRRDKAVQKMQQRISITRAKPSLLTCIPMVIFFSIINVFYVGIPVALPAMNPWHIPLDFVVKSMKAIGPDGQFFYGWINFTTLYFLCSFTMSIIIQRVFGNTQTFNWGKILSGENRGKMQK